MYSVWVLSRWHQTPYTCIYLYYMTLWWWPTMPVHAVYNISAIHRTSTRLKIVSFLYLRVYYNQTGDLFFIRIFNSNRLWGNILCIQPNGMRCYTIIDTISVYSSKKKNLFIYCTLSKFMKFPFLHILDNIRFSRLFEKLIFDACVSLLQLKWL